MSPDRSEFFLYERNNWLRQIFLHITFYYAYCNGKKSIAEKPRDAFRGQSRSPNMVPFHMLGMVFYIVCYSNFVRKTKRFLSFWDIRLQKCRNLQQRLRVPECHWKCHHSIQSLWLPIDVIVTIWLYLESFLRYSMSKNIATLKSQSRANQGHWKWYHSTDCIWFSINVQ